jgi:hypothetical protein
MEQEGVPVKLVKVWFQGVSGQVRDEGNSKTDTHYFLYS